MDAMDTAAITRDWVGRVIDGKFTLREWLGGSERGAVFRTELEGPRAEKAAIKLIPADAADAGVRYASWASSMKLSHPHLMSVFRFGRCQIDGLSLIYAVTEFADEVLAQVLPDRPISPDEAQEMLDPVVDALSYLHGRGFVHGYLKPTNIMVVDNRLKIPGDNVRLAGNSRKSASALSAYDAPELVSRPISPPADLWSLGVTLVEALTQREPAVGPAAPFEPGVIESIPQPFADIARHCLRENPAQRWSADDVKRCLGSGAAESAPAAKAERKSPAGKLAALIAALAVLIVIAFVLLPHSKRQPATPAAPANSSPTAPAATSQPATPSPAPATPQASSAPTPQSAAQPSPQAAPPAPQVTVPPPREPQAPQGSLVKGSVAQRVLPDVPQKASATIQGKVSVAIRAAVDARGAVSVATFESEGPSKYFGRLALDASREWKFQPAQSGGQAVPSVWILRFEFRNDGTEAAAEERSP
jgi:hypothetical protein